MTDFIEDLRKFRAELSTAVDAHTLMLQEVDALILKMNGTAVLPTTAITEPKTERTKNGRIFDKVMKWREPLLWILLFFGVIFLFFDGKMQVPDIPVSITQKDEIHMSAEDRRLVASAMENVKRDIDKKTITNVEDAKKALKGLMPMAVRDVVIVDIKADTIDDFSIAMDTTLKKISVK